MFLLMMFAYIFGFPQCRIIKLKENVYTCYRFEIRSKLKYHLSVAKY